MMKRSALFLVMVTLCALLLALPSQAAASETMSLDELLTQLASMESTETAEITEPTEAAEIAEPTEAAVAEAGLPAMKSAIAQYLDSQSFTYSYDDSRECFSFGIRLDSNMGQCDVGIFVYEDGFEVFSYSPIRPKPSNPEQMAAAAEFLTRANYNLYLGNFEMDYRDGEVRFKTSIKCFEQIPLQSEIEWLVDIPYMMMDKYGDGLINVVMTGADPAAEIAKIEE